MKKTTTKPKSKPVKKVAAKSAPRAGLWHSPERPCGKTPGHDGVTTDPAKVNCAACLKLRARAVKSDEEDRVEPPSDFRRMPQGESTAWGPIEECPCGQMGAKQLLKFWPGVTRFAHTLERVAGVSDIRVIGNKFVDDGTTGRLRPALVHYVDAQNNLIEREERVRTRPERVSEQSTADHAESSPKRAGSKTAQGSVLVRATTQRARGRRELTNQTDWRCVNHATCKSKTRKHARGLCYACYCAERKSQRAAA